MLYNIASWFSCDLKKTCNFKPLTCCSQKKNSIFFTLKSSSSTSICICGYFCYEINTLIAPKNWTFTSEKIKTAQEKLFTRILYKYRWKNIYKNWKKSHRFCAILYFTIFINIKIKCPLFLFLSLLLKSVLDFIGRKIFTSK